ncbi:MAG TPA: T9SS type A sorting domain-containing protein, partial [Bacteroidia bacterium]|nr:T9SS type A sorting domain-containing protein [Bacteroidia bacterium]
DFFYDVTPTWDGNFILAGGTYGLGMGDEDMYFVKIDGSGNVIWTRTFGGVKADEARGIVETGDSLIAAVGFSYSLADTLGDSWILRMREINGDTLLSRTAGFPNAEDQGFGICDNPTTGRFLICGYNNFSPTLKYSYFGAFFYNGSNQFMYSSGNIADQMLYGITARANGTIGAVGAIYSTPGGNGDLYFFHNRTNWESFPFGTNQLDIGYSIDLAHDDGYIACGYTEGFNSFVPNVYLVKIDTSGLSSTILSIREQPTQQVLAKTSIFPNPAQDEALINYDSYQPIRGELKMEIFDIAGRFVMSVPSSQWQRTTSRNATCQIETRNLNAGIYQFVIHDESGTNSSGKFIVTH